MVNGGEPRLRGCIGSLEARGLINGFRDYALNRFVDVVVIEGRFTSKAPSCSENQLTCYMHVPFLADVPWKFEHKGSL